MVLIYGTISEINMLLPIIILLAARPSFAAVINGSQGMHYIWIQVASRCRWRLCVPINVCRWNMFCIAQLRINSWPWTYLMKSMQYLRSLHRLERWTVWWLVSSWTDLQSASSWFWDEFYFQMSADLWFTTPRPAHGRGTTKSVRYNKDPSSCLIPLHVHFQVRFFHEPSHNSTLIQMKNLRCCGIIETQKFLWLTIITSTTRWVQIC